MEKRSYWPSQTSDAADGAFGQAVCTPIDCNLSVSGNGSLPANVTTLPKYILCSSSYPKISRRTNTPG